MINSVHQYLDRIGNLLFALNNQGAVVNISGPDYFPRGISWNIAKFRAQVRYESGHVLDVMECFKKESPNKFPRKFSYYFAEPVGDDPGRIFLFDCHGIFDGKEHFHPEDDLRLEAGDLRLNGFSPRDIDLDDVLGFVDMHFSKKPFPWVQQ